jgi:serine/threonine protein phosphatase 1
MNFKKFLRLPKNNQGNDWVIPDIHGCIRTLNALIDRLNLGQYDRLFLLGDYVNKGPASDQVLDRILDIRKSYEVTTLRGNHEQMILDFAGMSKYEFEYHLTNLNSMALTDNNLTLKADYRRFFQKLPYYIELPDYFLVHGGFDFQAEHTFREFERMIWLRNMKPDFEKLMGKRVIHGHIPHALDQIKRNIDQNNLIIPLDNGCVYHDRSGLGNLLALELNTMNLMIQQNIDFD